MATIRVIKNKNYTVMSNYHLQDRKLSLKAKGILSIMLSLPEGWNYSTEGLATLSKDGKDSVSTTLQELEQNGYLIRQRKLNEKGQFDGYIYNIYEQPQTEKPYTENPSTDKPPILNNNILNTKRLNKHIYGTYKHIQLTDEEIDRLKKEYGEEETNKAINYLDEYIEMKGTKYKNHNLVLRKWVFDAIRERKQKKEQDYLSHEYTKQELDSLYDKLDDIEV